MNCPICDANLLKLGSVKVFIGGQHDTPATLSCRMTDVTSCLQGERVVAVSKLQILLDAGMRVIRTHCLNCNEYLKGVL